MVYAAKLKVNDGQEVQESQTLVEWDPYANSIVTEVSGSVAFGDVVEGVTMKEDFDEITGLSTKVIISHRDEKNSRAFPLKMKRRNATALICCPQAHISTLPKATRCTQAT